MGDRKKLFFFIDDCSSLPCWEKKKNTTKMYVAIKKITGWSESMPCSKVKINVI